MANPSFIELCAGCGGLSSGLIKSGFKPIFLNDVDKDCCETLKLNHNKVIIKQCDFTTLNFKKNKNLDLLCCGSPCQSYSIAGKRKGLDDKRGNLLLEFILLVSKIQPKTFLIENVKGLLSHDNGKTFKFITNKFPKDYIINYKVLNAMNYNVPQKRERLFIIGVRKDICKEYIFPKPREKIITLQNVLINCPKSKGVKYSENKKKIMRLIPQGGCWINLPIKLQKEYLGKSFYSGGGKRGIARRLSMNEPSLTLTTSPCQKQTERCHPLYTRPFTIREYARIQTFSDDYKFSGSIYSQYKQIGNAVPVNLAYSLGKSLINILKD